MFGRPSWGAPVCCHPRNVRLTSMVSAESSSLLSSSTAKDLTCARVVSTEALTAFSRPMCLQLLVRARMRTG
eukprot:489193-Pyramimonas_sp.AAC.1